jgi:hypothetical protein
MAKLFSHLMNHKSIFTIFSILILITVSYGCIESSPSSSNFLPDATLYLSPTPTPATTPPDNLDLGGNQSNNETLRIGAFNIHVFGISKASKPEVMDVLADIIRTYDIIAIQEIRDASQTALPALVDLVNSDGSQYDYVVSERLGRTTNKEQ